MTMLPMNEDPKYDLRSQRGPRTGAWPVYKRLLGYTWRYKGRLVTALVFALVMAASFTLMVASIGASISLLFDDEQGVRHYVERNIQKLDKLPNAARTLIPYTNEEISAGLESRIVEVRKTPLRTLGWVSVVIIGLALIGATTRFLQEYFAGTIGANISVTLGHEMYRNVMQQSMRFFEQHPTGELLARFTNDIFMINRGLTSVFVKLMREPVLGLFFLGWALSIDAQLTLVGLCVLPPTAYAIVRVGRRFKKSVRRSLEKIATMAMVVNETFSGIAIVKGFSMEPYESRRTETELGKLRRYLIKMVKADALVGPVVESVLVIGLVAFVLYSIRRVIDGQMSPGELVTLYGCMAMSLDPVRKLSAVNNMIMTSVASAERVFEFIDIKPDITESPNARELSPLRESLRFEHVSFSYNGEIPVLEDLDFEIRKGEMVAVVGFSGAGKSTLAKLVPRFYDVCEGAIRVDGVDIREATFDSLRGQIGIVTQETFLFNESVRTNIAFGREDFSESRIREAARAAYAEEFIDRLPQGYNTVVGERGATLSGGQRQRIAIARAIIKDPAILILDEATSSLDSESEQAIQRAIDQFVQGRTTLVIAHRLSTIQRANRILVLDSGRVVEQGTHQELIAKGGLYRRLHDTQFAAAEGADA